MKELLTFTLLQNVKYACIFFAVIFFIIAITFMFSWLQNDEKDKKFFIIYSSLFLFFTASAIIIPEKKELVYMYVTGKIADNIKQGNLTDKDYQLLDELLDLQKKEEKK